MRPSEVLRRATDYLERHEVDSPRPTAEVLLASVLGTDRAGLYSRSEGLSPAEAKQYGRLLCHRCAGTPTQHLTGEQGFRRLVLRTEPSVFIPRPETETVVQEVLDAISAVADPVVVDVGTGTGAIALAIKDERPDAQVLGIDNSRAATDLARANAAELGLDIEVLEGDLLGSVPLRLQGRVDVVVSNPPYVRPEEFEALPPEVRAEPIDALVGDSSIYRRLFAQARLFLRPGGAVVLEVEETRGEEVRSLGRVAGFQDFRLLTDSAGKTRVLVAHAPR
jgi:release factor glutamine methyltransferase